MTAGRPAGLRYYDDYTGLRAPGEQARLAAYAEFFNNMNAEFFGGGAQTLLARYDRDWRSPRFHCEHSRISELQEEVCVDNATHTSLLHFTRMSGPNYVGWITPITGCFWTRFASTA